MKPLPLLLAFLFVAPPAARAALEIRGELKVKPHRMAVLSAVNAPDGAALVWDFDEAALHVRRPPASSSSSAHRAPTASSCAP